MGGSHSCIPCSTDGCLPFNDNEDSRVSKGIDKGLRETRRNLSNTSKILLLGAGDSGKSTIIKQMRIINGVQFTEYEREIYRVQLFYNLVGGMRTVLEALRDLPPLDPPPPTSSDPISPSPLEASRNSLTIAKFNNMDPPLSPTTPSSSRDPSPIRPPESESTDPTNVPLPVSPRPESQSHRTSIVDPQTRTSLADPRPSSTSGGGLEARTSTSRRTPSPNPPTSPTTSHPLPERGRSRHPTHNPTPSHTSIPTAQLSLSPPPDHPHSHSHSHSHSNEGHDRAPTRSPSISLNLFPAGSLTPRQLSLLQEFTYAPDLRPGQGFPLEFLGWLVEIWWGVEEARRVMDSDNPSQPSQPSLHPVTYPPPAHEGRARGRGYRPQSHYAEQQEEVREEGDEDRGRDGVRWQIDRIERESGVALPDNLMFLFESPERLAGFFEEDYVPSDEDILRCRCRTTGIQETVFSLSKALLQGNSGIKRQRSIGTMGFRSNPHAGTSSQTSSNPNAVSSTAYGSMSMSATATATTTSGSTRVNVSSTGTSSRTMDEPSPLKIAVGKTKLHMVDVGGQRSERRKWIHCFQDVTAVLFLVGLSGYNQGLVEDPMANQMQDAMALWDGVCASPWLKNTSLILFLNKTDLFAAKVSKFPITDYFPDYEGDKEDVRAGMEYFRKRFMRVAVKSMKNAKHATSSRPRKESTKPTSAPPGQKIKPSSRMDGKIKHLPGAEGDIQVATNNTVSSQGGASTAVGGGGGVSFDAKKSAGKERKVSNPVAGKGKEREHLRDRTVYTHFTNATDTGQLRVVIVAVCDIILRDNFAHANLI